MRLRFMCGLALILKLLVVQALEINVDVSQLKSNFPIYLTESGVFYSIPKSGLLKIDVEHIPTLVYIVSIKKRKIITHKIIWLTGKTLKIKGSIGQDNIELLPKSTGEGLNEGIEEEWRKIDFNNDDEYFVTEPYLVFLLRNIKLQELQNLKSMIERLPDDKLDFWAVKVMARYLANLEGVGFDSSKNKFEHLTATNRIGERQLFEMPSDKFLLIDFSSSSCRPCLEDIDKLVVLNNDFGEELEILSVWDDPKQEPWLSIGKKQKDKITWVSLRDDSGAIFKKFEVEVYPTYFLLDRTGKVVKKWKGSGVDKVRKYLKQNIAHQH